jgi:hypothetical protein
MRERSRSRSIAADSLARREQYQAELDARTNTRPNGGVEVVIDDGGTTMEFDEQALERRILQEYHRNPLSSRFDVEHRLGIATDVAALVKAFDIQERLTRDGLLDVLNVQGELSMYQLTETGIERLLELTASGEMPDVEAMERAA